MSIFQFLKFKPILKDKIWGGEKLATLLNKQSARKDIEYAAGNKLCRKNIPRQEKISYFEMRTTVVPPMDKLAKMSHQRRTSLICSTPY